LAGVTIQQEKGLGHFGWFFFGAETVPAHLALAVAGDAVRVQGQERAGEMSAGPAQFAQGDLQLLGLVAVVTLEQVMDGRVGGDKGQAIGQLKPFLGKRARETVGTQTHGRFIDQMQSQAGFDVVGGLAGPGAQQIPSAQAQVFGQEQPNANLIARNLGGQQLADLALQTFGIGGRQALLMAGALGLNEAGRVGGIKRVEFFFAGRNRR
jgi:hypothetical protein